MKSGKFIIVFLVMVILSCFTCLSAFAGSYTVTQYMGGSFTAPIVTVTNSAGGSITANAFKLTSSVTNVSKISGSLILNSVDSGSSINMTVYYSTDGTSFTAGTTINLPLNTKADFTINFGSSTKTIVSLFVIPTTRTWPGYNYGIYTPSFTRILTDTTAPTISLSQQSNYSNTGVTVTAYYSDSESGVSVRKWALGIQSPSYFSSNGTSFYSSFTATSNGYYTVYAKDAAGNEAVNYIYVTKLDTSPPVISASASTEWATSNTITVNISDSQSGVSVKKWAYGSYPAAYFYYSGNTLSYSMITVTNNGIYTIYAKDIAGNESVSYVTVSYVDNTVSITHPLTVDYVIDPNLSTPFSASDIRLINNSRIKVSVSVQELSSSTDASLCFSNVSPSTFSDWDTLNKTQSKTYIALGLKVNASNSWYSITANNPIYACDITSNKLLGILNPNGASGNLSLCAKHGLAWDNSYTSKHKLVFLFETYS